MFMYYHFPQTGRCPEMFQWSPLISKTLEHRKALFALPSFPETLKGRSDFSEELQDGIATASGC